jgi:anaerobic dimethyl sulfoxide reductase subunit B (iron-sulfur subunit)
MSLHGLLIDYNFCTGCHSCEMACKQEHGYKKNTWGIKLAQNGPWQLPDGKWEYNYIPVPTELCDLCADRVGEGRLPTCVHHCQALCMDWGPVEELAKRMTSPRMVLFTPCER